MASKEIKLGVIGLSKGNGHPYSWAAICNGYDTRHMRDCPFPVIPQYLAEQEWPEAKIENVRVTHIWTQDRSISEAVAKAALIPHVVEDYKEMIPVVDGVLLARDDAEFHLEMALPFIEAGLPIYIDKPMALSLQDADQMWNAQHYTGQIYSCSALRYAKELLLTEEERRLLGKAPYIRAQVANSWEKYAVHLIEPIVADNPERGVLLEVDSRKIGEISKVFVRWENLTAEISTFGSHIVPLQLEYFGSGKVIKKAFHDSFNAFRFALVDFVQSIQTKQLVIPWEETRGIVNIIEQGIEK